MEIDHEPISTVILFPLIQEGLLSRKSVVSLTDCLDMTIAVDLDVKESNKKQHIIKHA